MTWKDEEVELLMTDLPRAIKTLGRSRRACYQKRMQIKKKDTTYNKDHVSEKYEVNRKFLKSLEAKTIIDAYSGEDSFWKGLDDLEVITNDINPDFKTNFNLPAKCFLVLLRKFGVKADIVDLDPFGSPWEEFEDSILIAKKGLIMTFGDGRNHNSSSPFLKKRYGIKKYDKYQIIEGFKKKASEMGVTLEVMYTLTWKQTWRVWFAIKNTLPSNF